MLKKISNTKVSLLAIIRTKSLSRFDTNLSLLMSTIVFSPQRYLGTDEDTRGGKAA